MSRLLNGKHPIDGMMATTTHHDGLIEDTKVFDGNVPNSRVLCLGDDDVQQSAKGKCRHIHVLKQIIIFDYMLEVPVDVFRRSCRDRLEEGIDAINQWLSNYRIILNPDKDHEIT